MFLANQTIIRPISSLLGVRGGSFGKGLVVIKSGGYCKLASVAISVGTEISVCIITAEKKSCFVFNGSAQVCMGSTADVCGNSILQILGEKIL